MAILVTALAMLSLAGCSGKSTLTLSTTTSTYDSGILDVLLPPFERANNVEVKVVAVGSGEAIELGKRGDADVVLAHAPSLELPFMDEGYGIDRMAVMHNDFVIVGPAADPADIGGMANAAEAFTKIATAEVTFVSRGDNSGTHTKEKAIWAAASLTPSAADPWYLSTGQGMGDTLRMAQEKEGYTLTDRGTYLALKDTFNLVILTEKDPIMANPYHVMAVNPAKVTTVKKYDMAKKFVDFMVSQEAQSIIANYGVDKWGQPLFFPDAIPDAK
ncbi:MAG: substrate-binding domain-containing protein [Chloroflexi bacterium]|nr:substrate-binding domain-containing protein [Chloroflexota bacterium]